MKKPKSEFHILQGRTAGFVTRIIAYVADVAVLAGLMALTGWLAVMVDNLLGTVGVTPWVPIDKVYLAMLPFLIGFYYVFAWALTGRTIGKWFMGLKVVGANGRPPTIGRSIIRLFGYAVSAIAFWVGFLWVIVDDERQAWHDHFAKTWVIYDYEQRKGGQIYESLVRRDDRDPVESG